MIDVEPLIRTSLDRLAPLPDASRRDWHDVRRRAGRRPARQLVLALVAAATVALLAVLAATPALGLRGRLVQLFSGGEPAPTRVVADFAQLDVGAPPGMATGVIASETREVMAVPLSTGKSAVLWVAPTRSGGFCLGLSTSGRGSGGGGGCDRDRLLRFSPGLLIPGPISPDGIILEPPVVIDGHTLDPRATKVEIRYQDGSVAQTPVLWVSAPIDAGFFIYEIPKQHWEAGHRPSTLILEDADGHELARAKGSLDEVLQAMSRVDPVTGAPAQAIVSQRRELISITTEQGTREALWVAPRSGGGQCHWLTSDGSPGRAYGCPPPDAAPQPAFAGGLISGSAPILFQGHVGPDVATLELHYQDGEVQRLQPVDGFFLAEIAPRHWPPGHRLNELVARDGQGRQISRLPFDTASPGTYPCDKPADVGGGEKACP